MQQNGAINNEDTTGMKTKDFVIHIVGVLVTIGLALAGWNLTQVQELTVKMAAMEANRYTSETGRQHAIQINKDINELRNTLVTLLNSQKKQVDTELIILRNKITVLETASAEPPAWLIKHLGNVEKIATGNHSRITDVKNKIHSMELELQRLNLKKQGK